MTESRDVPIETRLRDAMRVARLRLPHLAELAAIVRVRVDSRISTAGVFESGRLLVNSDFASRLNLDELAFVLAHELMHLALATHRRGDSSNAVDVNFAHDLIINDMLVRELGGMPPADGVWMEGARHMSLERLLAKNRREGRQRQQSWDGASGNSDQGSSALGIALHKALGLPGKPVARRGWDVLSSARELEWFPDLTASRQERDARAIASVGGRSLQLKQIIRDSRVETEEDGRPEDFPYEEFRAMERIMFRPPWELVLQKWIDSQAPAVRSYARPSRRGVVDPDIARPGRSKGGWMLNVILDTSGSMNDVQSHCLGLIASFADTAGVDTIRVLQCDTSLASDVTVTPEDLVRFPIRGFGGSDMSPAMYELAKDPETTGAIILTDGYIACPSEAMPYEVLWVLTGPVRNFAPPYGRVVEVSLPHSVPDREEFDLELVDIDDENLTIDDWEER